MSTPLVLLHGLACSPAAFDRLRPYLDAKAFAPSLTHPWAVEDDARSVVDAIANLVCSAGEPATIVGHSRGGLVATAVAELAPDLVDNLILVNTPPTVASRLTARNFGERLLQVPVLGEIAWAAMPAAAAARGLQSSFAPVTAVPEVFVRDLKATGHRPFVQASSAIDSYLERATLLERLQAVPAMVDVIFGTLDQRVSYAPYERFPDDRFHRTLIAEAGHTPIWETPERVAQVINAVLRSDTEER